MLGALGEVSMIRYNSDSLGGVDEESSRDQWAKTF